MTNSNWLGAIALGAGLLAGTATAQNTPPPSDGIPAPAREFRAAWVATVANIDWPSARNLTTAQQQAEAIAILDRAVELNMNGIVFQVRPSCDVFYKSEIEPWSVYLTGTYGQAPEPFYDPLEFWVTESHKRGIELHTWFNPYRAYHPSSKAPLPDSHIVKRRPDLAPKLEDGHHWLIPTEKDVQDLSIAVVMEVVRNYDIDGVHFDDYFYPYKSYNGGKDFPDDASWAKYQASGGTLSRDDWRRDGVNVFIERLYREIKAEKPHVKFGMSPFGIWRPNNPPGIAGLDQYSELYADAKLWWNKGWVDYYTPQLYWPIDRVQQSFPILLAWWAQENTMNRNLWPGLATFRANDGTANSKPVREVINEIMVTRAIVPNGPGNIHFSMKRLMNLPELVDTLKRGPYARPALVPASPWLDSTPPPAPTVNAAKAGEMLNIAWDNAPGGESAFVWVVYLERGGRWESQIVGGPNRTLSVQVAGTVTTTETANQGLEVREVKKPAVAVSRVAVSAVDRLGNEGPRTIVPVR